MFHVFHLGPVTLGKGRQWMVGAIDEWGGWVPPVLHRTLDSAVKRMVQGLGAEDVTLEPALAADAPRLGVGVGPLPGYLADAPAVLAFSVANAQEHLPRGTGIATFLATCRAFGSVAPWNRFAVSQPLLVSTPTRNGTTTREALVTGGSGEPCGLMLFDRPGDALRGLAALRNGDARASSRFDAIALVFRPDPEWAVNAVRTAFSLPEFPSVFRARRGHLSPATETELGVLTAALTAVAALASEPETSAKPVESSVCIDGDEFSAVAYPPGSSPPADVPKARARRAKVRVDEPESHGLRLTRPEDLN